MTAALALALCWGAACSPSSAGSGPLAGVYRAAMGSNVLTMRADQWRLRSGIRVKSGVFRLAGQRIAFIHETANNPAYSGDYCRGERDTYRWSLTGRTLSFRVIGVPCDANLFAVLTVAGPWKPVH